MVWFLRLKSHDSIIYVPFITPVWVTRLASTKGSAGFGSTNLIFKGAPEHLFPGEGIEIRKYQLNFCPGSHQERDRNSKEAGHRKIMKAACTGNCSGYCIFPGFTSIHLKLRTISRCRPFPFVAVYDKLNFLKAVYGLSLFLAATRR